MQKKIMKEYQRRVKKVIGSKLSRGNTIKVINAWAVSVVRYRYSRGIADFSVDELKEVDRKTKKLLTLNGALRTPQIQHRQALSPTCIRFKFDRGMHQTGGTWTVRIFESKSTKTSPRVSPILLYLVIEQTAKKYKVQQKKKQEEEWRKNALHVSQE